jgi:hypothetical protein
MDFNAGIHEVGDVGPVPDVPGAAVYLMDDDTQGAL